MNLQDIILKNQKVPVIEYPSSVTEKPIVSVCVLTYQHKDYIKECLDGILMQKTDFPLELLLGDDESTDGTREICIEYAKNHPEIIRFYLHKRENNIVINGRPTGRFNLIYSLGQAQGRYIALCEGDDYWTDPYKLQKQVDILESDENIGLIHTDCDYYYEDKDALKHNANQKFENTKNISDKEDLFLKIIDGKYKVRTATVLIRKDLFDGRNILSTNFLMLDTPLWLELSQITTFYYMDSVTAVYRVVKDSASRKKNFESMNRFKLSMFEMRIYYLRKFNYPISYNIKNRYNKYLLNYKLFDINYEAQFPLIGPSVFQNIVNKFIKIEFLRNCILFGYIKIKTVYNYIIKYSN